MELALEQSLLDRERLLHSGRWERTSVRAVALSKGARTPSRPSTNLADQVTTGSSSNTTGCCRPQDTAFVLPVFFAHLLVSFVLYQGMTHSGNVSSLQLYHLRMTGLGDEA